MPNQPRSDNRAHPVRFKDDLWAEIEEYAEEHEISASEVVRDCVEDFFSRYVRPRKRRPRGGKRRQQQAT